MIRFDNKGEHVSAPRRIVILIAVLTLSACSDSPTTPDSSSYQGQWVGQWVRQSCTDGGALAGFCGSLTTGGPPGQLILTVTQSGTSTQGTLMVGAIQLTVAGPVNTDGSLSLSGQGTVPVGALLATVNLAPWRSTKAGNTMTGSFQWTVTFSGVAGAASVTGLLQNVAR